jgi:hypothetical protein
MEGSTPSHTEPPCEIGAASEDKNGSLGVETSSDRRQVFISGHDLTVYDTQNVLVALYPDPFVWPTNDHFGWDAEATYEVYGQEFPAGFVFYTWNGRETVPIYSTGKSVSR